jgi:hypothetical protein
MYYHDQRSREETDMIPNRPEQEESQSGANTEENPGPADETLSSRIEQHRIPTALVGLPDNLELVADARLRIPQVEVDFIDKPRTEWIDRELTERIRQNAIKRSEGVTDPGTRGQILQEAEELIQGELRDPERIAIWLQKHENDVLLVKPESIQQSDFVPREGVHFLIDESEANELKTILQQRRYQIQKITPELTRGQASEEIGFTATKEPRRTDDKKETEPEEETMKLVFLYTPKK